MATQEAISIADGLVQQFLHPVADTPRDIILPLDGSNNFPLPRDNSPEKSFFETNISVPKVNSGSSVLEEEMVFDGEQITPEEYAIFLGVCVESQQVRKLFPKKRVIFSIRKIIHRIIGQS